MPDIKRKNLRPLVTFSTVIFFITIADAVMSYISPVYIEHVMKNSFMMGIVLSCSSLFGIIFDLFLSEKLNGKTYKFIIFWTIVLASVFPAMLGIFPPYIPVLLAAMVVWSTYYELRDFSKYNFIQNFVAREDHVSAWGMVETFESTAYLIGPALAVYLLSKFTNFPFLYILIILVPAYLIYFLFLSKFRKDPNRDVENLYQKRSLLKDIKVMRSLWKRVWPLILFMMSATMIDVCFWVIGVLFSEELRLKTPIGASFLVIYGLPALINGIIASKTFRPTGKKRSAFLVSIIAACGMIGIGISKNIFVMLGLVFITSIFYGQTFILMESVFEDYVSRLKEYGNDMVGISQVATNLAYWLGPIILGYVAEKIGNQMTFSVVGIFIIGVSLFVMTVVPRKVKMPNKEIKLEVNS